MNLYRIHYAWRSGGASSSEIKYYEREDRLKVDLLDHHLDIMAERGRSTWLEFCMALGWRRFRGKDEDTRRTTKIIKVEKVVNDEWVPVEYSFVEPDVVLNA